jgi:hypothetical protein
MIKIIEDENKELHWSFFRTVLDYKDAWYKELHRREQLGIKGPEPLPHPDDLILDAQTGKVTVRGPLIERDKDRWLLADMIKSEYRKIIAGHERQLRRSPDPDSGTLLKKINDMKHDLSRFEEHYPDSVTDRVVRSRTNSSGEIEFVDQVSVLKLIRNA